MAEHVEGAWSAQAGDAAPDHGNQLASHALERGAVVTARSQIDRRRCSACQSCAVLIKALVVRSTTVVWGTGCSTAQCGAARWTLPALLFLARLRAQPLDLHPEIRMIFGDRVQDLLDVLDRCDARTRGHGLGRLTMNGGYSL